MAEKINNNIKEVKAEFDEWRSTRQGREKTPENLRNKAVQLLEIYSSAIVCKALKISPNQLRTWRSRSTKLSANFIEIPIQQLTAKEPQTAALHYVVIERVDGNRLIANLPASKIESLLSVFLST